MRSMTGIGRGSAMIPGTNSKIDVEIRSHNRRFLEVSVKCPTSLLSYENQVKKEVVQALTRGYVVISIQMDEKTARYSVDIDHALLGRIVKLKDEIVRRYHIKDNLDFDTIIQIPGIVKFIKDEITGAKVYKGLKKALNQALKGLILSKKMEGVNIARSIQKSIRKIKRLLEKLMVRAPLRKKEKRKRLERLLADAVIKATPEKMAEEILYYADRLDITEECARIKSHLTLLIKAIKKPTPGRRINFLVQELYREANTTAAKAYDVHIAELVVGIKEEIEKIREQVQNVE